MTPQQIADKYTEDEIKFAIKILKTLKGEKGGILDG